MKRLKRREQKGKYQTPTSWALSLGSNMALGMLFFTFLGMGADQKFHTEQKWTLTGIFLGLFYCGYEVWKLVRQMNKEEEDKEQ